MVNGVRVGAFDGVRIGQLSGIVESQNERILLGVVGDHLYDHLRFGNRHQSDRGVQGSSQGCQGDAVEGSALGERKPNGDESNISSRNIEDGKF